MKNFLSICFCLSLLISATACNNIADNQNSSGSAAQSATENVSSKVQQKDPFDGLKHYTSESGLSLYMSDGFTEKKIEGAFCYYEGKNSILSCNVETFDILENVNVDTSISEQEYARLIVKNNGFECDVKTDEYGNICFTYEKNIEGNDFTYFAYVKKTDKAFWTCNFACLTSQKSFYENDFSLWASSIEIK